MQFEKLPSLAAVWLHTLANPVTLVLSRTNPIPHQALTSMVGVSGVNPSRAACSPKLHSCNESASRQLSSIAGSRGWLGCAAEDSGLDFHISTALEARTRSFSFYFSVSSFLPSTAEVLRRCGCSIVTLIYTTVAEMQPNGYPAAPPGCGQDPLIPYKRCPS